MSGARCRGRGVRERRCEHHPAAGSPSRNPSLVIPRATPPMNPERISFFVTNFADEIGGNVHVAVLPTQLRGDLLCPGTDAAVNPRIEGLAREDVLIHGFFVGLL